MQKSLRVVSASAERVGQEVCGFTCRVHIATARLGCKRTMVGTGQANSHPGSMNRLRKCYSHLAGSSFLAGKASWALSGCLPTENADCYMLINEWAWLRSRVCLLRLKVHLDSVLESELRQT